MVCTWLLGDSPDSMVYWYLDALVWRAQGFDTPEPEDDRRGTWLGKNRPPTTITVTPEWFESLDGGAFVVAGFALTDGQAPELFGLFRVGAEEIVDGSSWHTTTMRHTLVPEAVAEALRDAQAIESFGWTAEDGPGEDEWVRRWTGRLAGGTVHGGPVEFREVAGLYVGLEVRSVPVTE